ncbi:hypothetical protein PMIT1320_00179 [Prochlorococcus marinus str. MIT 1320]|nr:hypothetical protein PMIT1320_00179 [Prochlorococcus marinus str. MIT 1320]
MIDLFRLSGQCQGQTLVEVEMVYVDSSVVDRHLDVKQTERLLLPNVPLLPGYDHYLGLEPSQSERLLFASDSLIWLHSRLEPLDALLQELESQPQ